MVLLSAFAIIDKYSELLVIVKRPSLSAILYNQIGFMNFQNLDDKPSPKMYDL